MNELRTLEALFADEDDLDLEALAAAASSAGENSSDAGTALSDAEIESLMREQLGLPALDVEGAIRSAEAGRLPARASNDDVDDFTDDEWEIVQTMRRICLDAIAPATKEKRRQFCVEWIFVRSTEEPRNGCSFHLACQMLKSRPWVIQALVQHFWFLRGIVVERLPFLSDELPEAVEHEAILHSWHEGATIARQVWLSPGVPEPSLRAVLRLPDEAFGAALERLVGEGVLGSRMGHLYVTSRPATFRRTRQAVSWSNSFVGE